jgi:hypothetical protein
MMSNRLPIPCQSGDCSISARAQPVWRHRNSLAGCIARYLSCCQIEDSPRPVGSRNFRDINSQSAHNKWTYQCVAAFFIWSLSSVKGYTYILLLPLHTRMQTYIHTYIHMERCGYAVHTHIHTLLRHKAKTYIHTYIHIITLRIHMRIYAYGHGWCYFSATQTRMNKTLI